MNFSLSYSGSPGSVSATLMADGKAVGTTTGLADAKAAKKWAKDQAKEYKTAQTTPESEVDNVFITLSGSKGFSL